MKKLVLLFAVILGLNCGYIDEAQEIAQNYEIVRIADPAAQLNPPQAPSWIVATSQDSSLLIEWQTVSNASSYTVYIGTSSGTYHIVINSATSPHTETGLTNMTDYFISVSASNKEGESPLSTEINERPGIVDNKDGTVSVMSSGLTWTKCNQSASGNTYNSSLDDCSLSAPAKLQVCDVDYYCDDGYVINEASMATWGTTSEAYYSCKGLTLSGGGWRLPTISELEELTPVAWPDIVNDFHWSGSGYMAQPQYGWAQAAYDVRSGNYTTPSAMRFSPYYVLCVR